MFFLYNLKRTTTIIFAKNIAIKETRYFNEFFGLRIFDLTRATD